MKHHLCIIYDGIANSVFESQLLIPFSKKIAQHPHDRGLLISFERSKPDDNHVRIVAKYPQITLIVLKKIPFMGSISLRYAAYQLEKVVAHSAIASVLARGPLAGWIAGHTKSLRNSSTIVQARGLAGQEYAYANIRDIPRYDLLRKSLGTSGERNIPASSRFYFPLVMLARRSLGVVRTVFSPLIPSVLRSFSEVECIEGRKKIVSNHNFHSLRTYQYERIERWCYGTYAQRTQITIHAVSNALKNYLIAHFNATEEKITVEQYDIPAALPYAEKIYWRTKIRTQLAIESSAYGYVYSGSAKAWQCPQETVAYASECYKKDTRTFLLILSQDSALFDALCTKYDLPKNKYYITAIAHADIYHYLAAADAGIVLREPHVINWVSRPTKILEYQAVGLKIIHNNTIEMLNC